MTVKLKKGKSVKVSRKKLNLISVYKNEDKELYEFEKQQEFLPFLLEFLLKIGFNKDDIDIYYFFGVSLDEDKSNHSMEEINEEYLEDPYSGLYLEIDYFKDSLHTIDNDKFDIEVIFFSSKINMIIRKKGKNKVDVGKIISENTLFKNER